MILTVTPNPALDVTYAVDALAPGRVHRVRAVTERAGGKGVNVARVLHQLRSPCAVLGLSGGAAGAAVGAELAAAGLDVHLLDRLPGVRRTLVVQGDDGCTTSLWEPGHAPEEPEAAADALVAAVTDRLEHVRVVTVSGSLPPGVPATLPARIARAAAAVGVPAVLDVDGAALHHAAGTAGAVLMPNVDELGSLTGTLPRDAGHAASLARAVVRDGTDPGMGDRPAAVVVTLGASGLVVVTADGAAHARPPARLTGNPTGAGDAACAAVARCLAAAGSVGELDPRRCAVEAVALSAASVLRPVAGEVDVDAYRRWRSEIVVEDL